MDRLVLAFFQITSSDFLSDIFFIFLLKLLIRFKLFLQKQS